MRDRDRPELPEPETVSIGGETSRGRLARWVERMSPWQVNTIWIASTALLAAVVLFTVLDSTGDAPDAPAAEDDRGADGLGSPEAATSATPRSFSDGHTIWIGYRGVMLSVPRGWAKDLPPRCKVTYTGPSRDVLHERCSPSVRAPTTMVWLRQPRPNSAGPDTPNDRGIYESRIRRIGSRFSQSVISPSTYTVVVVSGTSRARLHRLVDSVRKIPAGWVSVPDLVAADPKASIRRIAKLGLVPMVNHNSGLVLPADTIVVDQNPTEGQVVPPGTRISFSVLPVDASP